MALDIDGITMDKMLSIADKPEVGKNADSILGMLQEVNTVLAELQKTVGFFQRIGVLPAVLRALGKKYDIDVDSPLGNQNAVVAPSANHKVIMEGIAKLTDQQLLELAEELNKKAQEKNAAAKPDSGKSDSPERDAKDN